MYCKLGNYTSNQYKVTPFFILDEVRMTVMVDFLTQQKFFHQFAYRGTCASKMLEYAKGVM